MNKHDWDERYREKKLIWSAGPNRCLVEEVVGMNPGRALDVACGEGRNAIWLAEQGWKVSAFDYSSVAIDKAKARCTELSLDMDLRVADATAARPGKFDLILFFYLHLPRDKNRQALAQAVSALAPGGTLLYVGHDQRNIKEGFGGPQDPSVLCGPEEISGLLSELQVQRAETIVRTVEKDGVTHKALDLLVRANRPA